MFVTLLRSKIHNATVTECVVDYEGSIEIDKDLLDAAGMHEYEKVLVSDINNANRFETYIIPGPRGNGKIGLNGAAAHLVELGDRIIIFAFAQMEEEKAATFKPTILIMNEKNEIKQKK